MRFILRGSLVGRSDFHTARDLTTARLTMNAWAAERRPCSGWIVDIETENGTSLARHCWSPTQSRWVRL